MGGNIAYRNNIPIPMVELVPDVTVEVTQKPTSDPFVPFGWYLQAAYFLPNFFESLCLHCHFPLLPEQLCFESGKSGCYVETGMVSDKGFSIHLLNMKFVSIEHMLESLSSCPSHIFSVFAIRLSSQYGIESFVIMASLYTHISKLTTIADAQENLQRSSKTGDFPSFPALCCGSNASCKGRDRYV